ncbi:BrnA antitoxin family protein [Granulosicoccus sp. 3-233]|uniref:BrnA antitoxin family protein n=1 Tax=Granulosicoccus sp. 3-233 TaxID=3417969 RepID=UPI003D32672F
MPDSSTDKTYIDLEALFKRADDVVATSVIGRPRRGSGYIPKVDAKIRLNAEVMAWLKDMGPRHYSRINGLLTALMEIDKGSRVEATTGSSTAETTGIKQDDPAVDAVDDADTGSSPEAATDGEGDGASGPETRIELAGTGQG